MLSKHGIELLFVTILVIALLVAGLTIAFSLGTREQAMPLPPAPEPVFEPYDENVTVPAPEGADEQ